MGRDRSECSGFTLIELMVTIAVLAILLAVALPSFADFFDKYRLRGAVDDVVSVISNARAESVKADRDVNISFGGTAPQWCRCQCSSRPSRWCCHSRRDRMRLCGCGAMPGRRTASGRGCRQACRRYDRGHTRGLHLRQQAWPRHSAGNAIGHVHLGDRQVCVEGQRQSARTSCRLRA